MTAKSSQQQDAAQTVTQPATHEQLLALLGELTEKLTAFLCKRKGIDPAGAELIPMEQYRQQQFDLLADGVRAALDMPAIYAAMGMQKGDNT